MGETPELTNAIVRADSLGLLHSMYLAFPYPLRRIVTVLGLMAALLLKPWINRNRPIPTPRDRLYTLSFWGVPPVDDNNSAFGFTGRWQGIRVSRSRTWKHWPTRTERSSLTAWEGHGTSFG